MRNRRLATGIVVALCGAGGGLALTALPASAVSLPDGRVYELVSPAPIGQEVNVNVPAWTIADLSIFGEHGVPSEHPFAVAPTGETIVYPADPPLTGGNGKTGFLGGGNQFIARRSPSGGWSQMDIQPPDKQNAAYSAFTNDLSVGILDEGGVEGEISPSSSYATTDGEEGSYVPLTPPGSGEFPIDYGGANSGTSSVASSSHVLFEADAALPVSGSPQPEYGGPESSPDLYDRFNGQLYLVNVLPDGKTEADATFGSTPGHGERDLSSVISADGSRIFWTNINTGNLYLREDDASADARTVQVDESVGGGGRFWTASSDGSKAFFTKHDLYEYDAGTEQATDLTPGVEVLAVLGASEDGEYVYYVDSNYNLYLWHAGISTFITRLSDADGTEVEPFGPYNKSGDWRAELGHRTAEVTPDGHGLTFMSSQSLTGYDNQAANGELEDEVFLYEATASKLTCVSCNPTGAPPVSTAFNTYRGTVYSLGAFLPESARNESQTQVSQPRLISDDGSRVFFQSGEPLVSQDTNGWLDVYEWERDGTGSCRDGQGCVYLLSGGTDPENSYLIGASASGNDVFFISRAQLVAQDQGDDDLMYDARVGGVQPAPEPECSGSGCQGVPPAPPVFATPSSVTFNGVGNFSPPVTTPKETRLTPVQKLAKAMKGCRAMRGARRRRACEATARKQYGPRSKPKQSNKGEK